MTLNPYAAPETVFERTSATTKVNVSFWAQVVAAYFVVAIASLCISRLPFPKGVWQLFLVISLAYPVKLLLAQICLRNPSRIFGVWLSLIVVAMICIAAVNGANTWLELVAFFPLWLFGVPTISLLLDYRIARPDFSPFVVWRSLAEVYVLIPIWMSITAMVFSELGLING